MFGATLSELQQNEIYKKNTRMRASYNKINLQQIPFSGNVLFVSTEKIFRQKINVGILTIFT
jgi:hypothetical protein